MCTRLLFTTLSLMVFTSAFAGPFSKLDQFAVGRTDRLKPGGFYTTYQKANLPTAQARIGLLPVTVQPNSDNPDLFYSKDAPALTSLVEHIESRLSQFNLTVTVADTALLRDQNAPSFYLGSSAGDNVPFAAEMEQEEFEKYPPMITYLANAKASWKTKATQFMAEQQLDYVIRIWVSIAQYPKADKGMFGKQVRLGTNYNEPIKFVSGELVPVEVLQISGYLVSRQGDVVRAGAEGVAHSDTPFWLQVLKLEKVLDDKTLNDVLYNAKREDLPGTPLKLEIALRNLLSQLINKTI